MTSREVARVLEERSSYDDLERLDQAVVRAAWDVRIAALLEVLDFTADGEAGESWVEADASGRPVTVTR